MSSKSRHPSPIDEELKTANIKPVLRWSLTLSSVAMLVFAGLTFAQVLPFPNLIGYLFIAIAAVDLMIAYTVFGG
jgi:hypothetical protein